MQWTISSAARGRFLEQQRRIVQRLQMPKLKLGKNVGRAQHLVVAPVLRVYWLCVSRHDIVDHGKPATIVRTQQLGQCGVDTPTADALTEELPPRRKRAARQHRHHDLHRGHVSEAMRAPGQEDLVGARRVR